MVLDLTLLQIGSSLVVGIGNVLRPFSVALYGDNTEAQGLQTRSKL